MKKLFPAIIMLALMLVSCSNEKPYKIIGNIELPDSLMVGDTLVATPSLEGWQVYMLNLDGESIDSVQISNNQFVFEGKVDKKNPFFVYLASDISVGLMAVEPGDISVVIDAENLTATGTPTNDLMSDIDGALDNLMQDTYSTLADLTQQYGDSLSEDIVISLNQDYTNQYNQLVDSFYQASKGGLSAVYCVNVMTSNVNSSAELLEALSQYPEEIQNSPLMQTRLGYMRNIEAYYNMVQGQMQDTTSFNLNELMGDMQLATPEEN